MHHALASSDLDAAPGRRRCRRVKLVPEDLLAGIVDRHGYAELAWTKSVPIAGDADFPVLELPESKLRYATERGFPMKLAARRRTNGSALLFVQLESFAIATHAKARWATPGRYTPGNEDERIDKELGFDEGWD